MSGPTAYNRSGVNAMWNRREFLLAAAAGTSAACSNQDPRTPQAVSLSGRERVDRVLAGQDVDCPPFTFYYHFGLEKLPGDHHAKATLDFHRKFRTDLVKVMSDFPYPKPEGNWYELEVVDNPFPEEIRALELIRDGLQGECHFIETVFNPWNQAGKLSSPEEVQKLKEEDPQKLLDALEAIAKITRSADATFKNMTDLQQAHDFAQAGAFSLEMKGGGARNNAQAAAESAIAFESHPYWRTSARHEQELRKSLYKALINAEVDGVVDIAQDLMDMLRKASG